MLFWLIKYSLIKLWYGDGGVYNIQWCPRLQFTSHRFNSKLRIKSNEYNVNVNVNALVTVVMNNLTFSYNLN